MMPIYKLRAKRSWHFVPDSFSLSMYNLKSNYQDRYEGIYLSACALFSKTIEDVINMFSKGIEFKLLVKVPHVENIYSAL